MGKLALALPPTHSTPPLAPSVAASSVLAEVWRVAAPTVIVAETSWFLQCSSKSNTPGFLKDPETQHSERCSILSPNFPPGIENLLLEKKKLCLPEADVSGTGSCLVTDVLGMARAAVSPLPSAMPHQPASSRGGSNG